MTQQVIVPPGTTGDGQGAHGFRLAVPVVVRTEPASTPTPTPTPTATATPAPTSTPTPPSTRTPPTDPPASAGPPPAAAPPARQAGAPRLKLSKRASRSQAGAGSTIVYTLVARNTGSASATGVMLCDDLPDHLTVASRGGGTLRRGQLCWKLGTMRAGARITKRFSVRVDRGVPAGRRIVNTATLDRTAVSGIDARARRTVRIRPSQARRVASNVTG